MKTAVVTSAIASLLGVASADFVTKRNPTGNFNQLYLASNYQNGSAAPGAMAGDAAGQSVITSGGDYGNDDGQLPFCKTIFIQTADNGGSYMTGWDSIPQVVGFYIDRNTTMGSEKSTVPVYMETNKPFANVKRVVITEPGKPRDSWKYTNLYRNSLNCAISNSSMPVEFGDVLITGPMWLTKDDLDAGAGQSSDAYFSEGGWSVGSKAQGPGSPDYGSFDVLDKLVKRFANQAEFPAVTSIMLAGHSLGGSMNQRYAMLRRDDPETDPLVRYWVGNPGAYVWPSDSRPVTPSNTSCAAEVNDWAYGINGTLPAYAYHVAHNNTAIYNRYRTRLMQYALGLLDDGPGDTHCEAQYQGSSHLTRGQNMQKALQAMPGGMPSTQSFNYVPDTSHQDYKMMGDPNSQEWMFSTDLNMARPAGTQSNSKSSTGGSSSSKSSSNNSKSGSSGASTVSTSLVSISLAVVAAAVAVIL